MPRGYQRLATDSSSSEDLSNNSSDVSLQSEQSPEPLIELTELDDTESAPKRTRKHIMSKRSRIIFHCTILLIVVALCVIFTGRQPQNESAKTTTNSSAKITVGSLAALPPGKKNIIMMVTDGTGPASINMARSFRQFTQKLPYDDVLEIDKHLVGTSRTRSNDSLITDSAAGATVFSCGLKTYNGAIGVDPERNPRGTILEALKLQGYKTGLVVTTSITDATPAAFNAHVDYRFMQTLIANQQLGFNTTLGRVTDLMIGGGRCYYLPGDSVGGCRDDSRNLIEEAEMMGFNTAVNREQFDEWDLGRNVTLPMLSLLAYYNIPYDLDRDDKVYPSLEEEAITALNALSRATEDSEQGFFLMIEGSRIDHAGHHNDPAAQVREVLAYDKAFQAVIDFADHKTDVPTYIVSTSDHETGGLDVGRQITLSYPEYLWKPRVLLNATHSGEHLMGMVQKFNTQAAQPGEFKQFVEKDIFQKGLGIFDYLPDDIERVIELKDSILLLDYLNTMVSMRAQVGWSTHGHTAVDVNVYAHANTEEGRQFILSHLLGNHENVEVGKFLQELSGANVDKVTEMLKGTPHRPLQSALDAHAEEISHGFTFHEMEPGLELIH